MLYATFIKKRRPCPFCDARQRTFASKDGMSLTYSLAPYAKYHLLVIPDRHVIALADLTRREWAAARTMIEAAIGVLRAKGIGDYTMLVRNGRMSGRSVRHLHFHVVPRHRIGDLDHRGRSRKVLTDAQVRRLSTEIAAALKRRRAAA